MKKNATERRRERIKGNKREERRERKKGRERESRKTKEERTEKEGVQREKRGIRKKKKKKRKKRYDFFYRIRVFDPSELFFASYKPHMNDRDGS